MKYFKNISLEIKKKIFIYFLKYLWNIPYMFLENFDIIIFSMFQWNVSRNISEFFCQYFIGTFKRMFEYCLKYFGNIPYIFLGNFDVIIFSIFKWNISWNISELICEYFIILLFCEYFYNAALKGKVNWKFIFCTISLIHIGCFPATYTGDTV